MSRFANKGVLVTGAASGLGRAAAIAFAAEGARVLVSDVNADGLEETAAMIGDAAIAFPADVSDPVQADAMVRRAVEEFGRLDCAFNNAGIGDMPTHIADLSLDAWQRMIAINLSGVFHCLQAEIRHMRALGGGAVVNTASVGARVAAPGIASYIAAKHGVVGLTKGAAIDLAGEGVRVNAICPGAMDTAMLQGATQNSEFAAQVVATIPIGRIAAPEEVARTVLFLCSDESAYITGEAIYIDGGVTIQ